MAIGFEESHSSLANPLFFKPTLPPIMREILPKIEGRSMRVKGCKTDDLPVSRMQDNDASLVLVQDALAGRNGAVARLVERLTPVIQARISRRLLRDRSSRPTTDAREYLADLTQEVFLSLFKNGGEVLRRWDPERGASLENFVGLVAERKAISEVRRIQGKPEQEIDDNLEPLDASPQAEPERTVGSKHLLEGLLEHFREGLSPLGWTMFELLFIWEGTVQEVSRDLDMNQEAVRKWRTRLRGMARQWMDRREKEGGFHG